MLMLRLTDSSLSSNSSEPLCHSKYPKFQIFALYLKYVLKKQFALTFLELHIILLLNARHGTIVSLSSLTVKYWLQKTYDCNQ